MDTAHQLPLNGYERVTSAQMRERMERFHQHIVKRRTVRQYSETPVSEQVIRLAIAGACSAPSGANLQPWHFVAIGDPDTKRRIRIAAEREEDAFYKGRAGDEWLDALKPLGTDAQKPFLETAPWLIAIFAQRVRRDEKGQRQKNYYVSESVGIPQVFCLRVFMKPD